jgi:hypothetical protein
VVHGLEEKAVQVDEIACDVQRRDLPLALVENLVAGGPAVQEEAALGRASPSRTMSSSAATTRTRATASSRACFSSADSVSRRSSF